MQGNIDPDSSPLPVYDGIVVSLSWTFSDNSIRLAYHHLRAGEEFFTDLPDETNKTWTLFKLKRKLVIECNNVKVWEIDYKDLFDKNTVLFEQRSMKAWSKTAVEIKFNELDSASVEYRSAGS